jgi:adenylate cyclase
MTDKRVQRRLAAILAADVVGYSRLMGEDEEGTLARMKKLRGEVIDPKIAEYGGRIFKTTGDGFLAEFASAVDAVRHAVDVQRILAERAATTPDAGGIAFRIGISLGDVMVDGDDLFGNGVNIAARMEGLAEAGGICVSGNVQEHIGNALDVALEDLGEQTVKNIDRPVRCYRVHLESAGAAATPAPAVPDTPSIAVLPFENLSADPEQEYFADGLSEDLITDLSKMSGLFVVARNSSFAFKGKNSDIRDVARRLNVSHVLEGSVRKMGTKVRINAQLIDAKTGGHLWADRYDGGLDDIFTLQDEIMARIVSAMELHLTTADRANALRKPTRSVEAYDMCLKGRAAYYHYTPAHLADARRHFEQAIELDPTYADAYGYLSYCLTTMFVFTWPGAEESLDHALALAEKSLALDPRSSVANARLGWVLGFLGQYDRATEKFERAIALDPRDAGAFYAYGETMNRAGLAEKGLPLIETAIGLEVVPPPGWEFGLGHSYVLLRRYDDALARFRAVLDRLPRLVPARVQLARLYSEMDRSPDAVATVEALREMAPGYTIRSAERMFPYADEDNRDRLGGGLRKAGLPA